MLNFKSLGLFLLILVCALPLRAGDSGANGMVFLTIDTDARTASLAGAGAVLNSGPSAAFYNPAGLSADSVSALQLSHHAGLAGISQEYGAFAFSRGAHHLAFSVNIFNNPDIEIRQGPSAEPDGVVDALNFFGAMSYARTIYTNWQVGATIKYLYQKLYLDAATGWAVDFGLQRRHILSNLDWGLAVQNLGSMSKLKNESTPLPLLVRTGMTWYPQLSFTPAGTRVAMDAEYIRDDVASLRVGSEIPVLKVLYLRAGYRLARDFYQWSAGLGLYMNRFHFNYAYIPDTYELGTGHHFSLNVLF